MILNFADYKSMLSSKQNEKHEAITSISQPLITRYEQHVETLEVNRDVVIYEHNE